MLSSYYAPKTCFCSLKLQEKKVSLMYSLTMIILDYLQYWNVCFVKATGLTFFSQILFTLGKQFSTLAPTISFKCLKKHVIKLTLISVCSSISIYVIEIPDLLGSGRLFFANIQQYMECNLVCL